MATALIATTAFVDDATLTSSGTVSSTLPLTNLQTMQPGETARWTSLTGINIVVDLGEAKSINCLALIGHNGSEDATWQIRGATSEANLTASPGYNSNSISMWPTGGKPDETGWTAWTSLHVPSSAQSFRWWRIDITDASNLDGYFEAGRLIIDSAWRPNPNIRITGGLAWVDESPIVSAVGGQMWPVARPRRRMVSFDLNFMSEDEILNNAHEIDRLRGRSKDVFFVRDPAATTHLHRRMIYGLITELAPIVNAHHGLYTKPYSIQELIA